MSARPGRTALLVVLSLALALLMAEGVLRLMDFSYYWSVSKRADPVTGWAPAPNTLTWQRFEGGAEVSINAAGLRDRERSQAKPPSTLRVAVLGDSFTEAVQVPLEETFWSVVQRQLAGCERTAARSVEVLNFGVSGYSTAQQLLSLRHRVWEYSPDVVVLALFAGNDLQENLRALDSESLRPYFTLQGQALVLDQSFTHSLEYRLRDAWYGRLWLALLTRSRLLQAADRARDLIRLYRRAPEEQGEPGRPVEPGVDPRVYREPTDPLWEAAWLTTEALLTTMAREVQGRGAAFLVVTLSTGAQVHPDPRFRGYYAESLGVPDLYYADRRIRALGEREGFVVLNLAPELAYYATVQRLWLHGFENSRLGVGHWNRAGHALAGQMLAKALCRLEALGPTTAAPGP